MQGMALRCYRVRNKYLTFWQTLYIIELVADRKWGVIMSPRTGRPPIENPKSERITVRLDKEHSEILNNYCRKNGVERAEAVREGIKRLKK